MAAFWDKVSDPEFDGVVKFRSHGRAKEVILHIHDFSLTVN
jgi:hypothetical protein